jgi:hypothetical protein
LLAAEPLQRLRGHAGGRIPDGPEP